MRFVFASVAALALVVGCSEASPPNADAGVSASTATDAAPTPDAAAPNAPARTWPECPEGSSYVVRTAPDLAPELVSGVRDALARWARAVPTFAYVIDEGTAPPPGTYLADCEIRVQSDDEADDNEAAMTNFYAHLDATKTRPAAALVRFHLGVIGEDLHFDGYAYALSLHEVGHVLGLEHETTRGRRSVMWPFVTIPGRLGCQDVERACSLWTCTAAACAADTWIDD